jgi:hypothetical protein
MTEVLVGTRKGLFALEGEPGGPFEISARAFAGDPVEYALRDPASGRVLASVTSPFYGPKIFLADDVGGDWEQASGIELPEGGDGLPHEHAYVSILRQAFGSRGEGDGLELYFGATSGHVYGSGTAGRIGHTLAEHLPPVLSVRAS